MPLGRNTGAVTMIPKTIPIVVAIPVIVAITVAAGLVVHWAIMTENFLVLYGFVGLLVLISFSPLWLKSRI